MEISWSNAQLLIAIFLFHWVSAILGRRVNHIKNGLIGNDYLKSLEDPVRAHVSKLWKQEKLFGAQPFHSLKALYSGNFPLQWLFLPHPHPSARVPTLASFWFPKTAPRKGTDTNTPAYTEMHTHRHTCIHTHICIHIHRLHTQVHRHMYIHINIYTQTQMHLPATHINTQTQTQTPKSSRPAHLVS